LADFCAACFVTHKPIGRKRIFNMIKQIAAAAALLFVSSAPAEEDPFAKAKDALRKLAPEINFDDVRKAPLDGFVEIVLGADILYVSEDGRYLVQGSVFDIDQREDLTEVRRSGIRGEKLSKVADTDLLKYGPKAADHEVWVFTDIDCGYCRRLHQQMAEYNDLGIRVNYLMFPRGGIGSESYDKAVSVWCAEDPHRALTDAKAGEDPKPKQCDNPITSHFELGRDVGVTGTPAIITKTGVQLGGYVPPAQLRQRLDDASS
jgi:thiol:disulfide interchange protein DsbC